MTALAASDVEALTGLTRPKQQLFVAAYCAGATQAEAARSAGYNVQRYKQYANKLLHIPAVAEAIKVVRAAMAERAAYGMEKFITEIDEAAKFAVATENATALVRARELKAKALGLLVDRMDMRVQAVPFRISIDTGAGEESP